MTKEDGVATRVKNLGLARKMMELVASGSTVPNAARSLNLSEKQARTLLGREMQRVIDDSADLREQVFAQELENMRLLRQAGMPRALRGEPRSIEVMIALGREYRKFLGLDAAMKIEVQASKVEDAITRIVELTDGAPGDVQPLRRLTAVPLESAG
jgi:hypothetical protein